MQPFSHNGVDFELYPRIFESKLGPIFTGTARVAGDPTEHQLFVIMGNPPKHFNETWRRAVPEPALSRVQAALAGWAAADPEAVRAALVELYTDELDYVGQSHWLGSSHRKVTAAEKKLDAARQNLDRDRATWWERLSMLMALDPTVTVEGALAKLPKAIREKVRSSRPPGI